MEQAQFLMWAKRRQTLSPHLKLGGNNPSFYDDSWEEQAFAEDASGPLGGCIWPPRSYSCSFCRREFRSAQALGGHMNVHRRDRARLKQSGLDMVNSHEHRDQAGQIQTPFAPLGLPYPSQANYNPNPSSILSPFVSPSSPNSKVSAPPSGGSSIIPSYSSSPFLDKNFTEPSIIRSPQPWPDTVLGRYRRIVNNPATGEKNQVITKPPDGENKEDTNLSVCLNLVIRTRPSSPDHVAEESRSCKRRRTDESPVLPFFMKNVTINKSQQQKEACLLSSSPGEDLDLELRLGGRPEVKLQS